MESNRLTALPDKMPPWLECLHFAGNRVEQFPECVGRDNVQIHDILAHANRLTYIPDVFGKLERLRHLVLHGNRIRHVPESLGQAKTMETLMLADNLLESLPESVGDLTQLQWLYLYNNRLTTLPKKLMWRAKCLYRVSVEGNPLSDDTLVEFLHNVPYRMRVVGIDSTQASSWHARVKELGESDDELGARVMVGHMLGWDGLYAKLCRASQLVWEGSKTRPVTCDDILAKPSELLVVAFSASQGEPEWLGVLGQALLKGGEFMTGRIVRDSERTFTDLHTEVHGFAPAESGESPPTCAAAIWQTFCGAPLLPADHTDDKPCSEACTHLCTCACSLSARVNNMYSSICLCGATCFWMIVIICAAHFS